MGRSGTSAWRRLCRTFAVLAALLVLAPLADAMVCLNEAHAEAAGVVVADPADQHGPLIHDDSASGACHHGHTHMPTPFVTTDSADQPHAAGQGACALAWFSDPDRAPALPTALERPPRA